MDNSLPALSALPIHNFTLAAARPGTATLRISATTVGFVPEPGMLELFSKAIAPELRACTANTVAAIDAQALALRVQASLHGWREGLLIAASHPFAIERPPWLLRSDDRLLVLYGVKDDQLVPLGNLDDRPVTPGLPGTPGARPWSASLQTGPAAGIERRLVSGALPSQPTPCFTAFFITMAAPALADDGAGPLRTASLGTPGGGGGVGGGGPGGPFGGLPPDDAGDGFAGPGGNPGGIGGGGLGGGPGGGGAGGSSGGGGGTGGGGFGGGSDAGSGGGNSGGTGGGPGTQLPSPVDPISDPAGNPVMSAVPEPAGWMLLLIGFIATGAASRRRRPAVVAA